MNERSTRADERRTIVVWMNMPSPYQDDFFAALARSPCVGLKVIYAGHMTVDREQLGWVAESVNFESRILAGARLPKVLGLAWRHRRCVNVVNSVWGVPQFLPALLLLCAFGRKPCFVHSEASNPQLPRSHLKVWLRDWLGRLVARFRHVRVLAISPMAERQFRQLGFPRERIHAFGYFRGAPEVVVPRQVRPGQRLLFLGQLVRRKGWDLLLAAMEPLWAEHPSLTLTIAGTGPDEGEILGYCRAHPEARIRNVGRVASDAIWSLLADHDLLVLPSRFDGWGIVVNEAASVGVPAVVSSQCGAACLVASGQNGFTFQSEEIPDLRRCLRKFMALDPARRQAMRDACLRQAPSAEVAAAARYLLRCVDYAEGRELCAPPAPWIPRGSARSES